jgi:hypothetical protein
MNTATAKRLFGINALVAWLGYGLSQFINIVDLVPAKPPTEPVLLNLFTQPEAGLAGAIGRVFNSHGYFTTWSNLLVAITLTMLYQHPTVRSTTREWLRNSALLMITMTFVLYNILLAPYAKVESFHIITNLLTHYITPLVTIAVWVVAGPRGRFNFTHTFSVFIVPIAYLVYTLGHGALASMYPYGFFDVLTYGYASVLTLMGGVIFAGYVVALIYYGVERLRSR